MKNYVKIVAADSLGVRSLATYVNLCGYKIFLDPGASLAPRRYGLPPHELEKNRLQELLNDIKDKLQESDLVVISHYHYDHYLKDFPELFKDKELFVKDPTRNINRSQKIRAWKFLKKSGLWEKTKINVADGRSFTIDGVLRVDFSEAVWHGDIGTKVGKVIMTRIVCKNTSIIFTSDVQGPVDPRALETLNSWKDPRPSLLILCGPPTYFSGFKVPEEAIVKGLKGVENVIKNVRPEVLILDHHIIRDIEYTNYVNNFKELGSLYDVKVLTGAEFMGRDPEPLEAWRKQLWKQRG